MLVLEAVPLSIICARGRRERAATLPLGDRWVRQEGGVG